MTEQVQQAQTEEKRPKRPLPIRLVRWLVFSLLVFVVLGIALLIFTETSLFRSMLRDTLNEELSGVMNAEVHIGEINGNIFSGWRIDDVSVRDSAGPILELKTLIVRYNPFRIPWKTIPVSEVSLVEPKIYITKAKGRDWNINALFPGKEDVDTSSSTFDWVLDVENIRIIDGSFLRYDSTQFKPYPANRLDFDHLELGKINLALSAYYSSKRKKVSIFQFHFENYSGNFSIDNISGDVEIDGDETRISTFSIATGRSSFQIDVTAQQFNPLALPDSFDIYDMPFALEFDVPKFTAADLQYFLPSLDFLGSRYSLDLKVDGTLRDLDIETLVVDAERTHISFTGNVRDIDEGGDLFIDVKSDDLILHGADPPKVLPGIPIPDYSNVGEVSFTELSFVGQPLNFHSEFEFNSQAGGASGYADLDLTGDKMGYDVEMDTRSMNLASIINQKKLSSKLTGHVIISGLGTTPGSMNATADMQFDTSRFMRYDINKLRGFVALGPSLLRTNIQLSGRSGSVNVDGNMTFENDSVTQFDIVAASKGLNLASFFPDDDLESSLNFSLTAKGNSIDINRATGSLDLRFQPSRFRNTFIQNDSLLLSLDQRDASHKEIRLASYYADLFMQGEFDIPRYLNYLQIQTDSLAVGLKQLAIAQKPDTSLVLEPDEKPRRTKTRKVKLVEVDSSDFMNAVYSIELHHPEDIARYFDASMFDLRGTYSGTIVGGLKGFNIGGEVKVSDFYYVDSLRTWKLASLNCSYDIQNLTVHHTLEHLVARVGLSIGDIEFNGTHLSKIAVQLQYEDASPRFSIRGSLDTTVSLALRGRAAKTESSYDITLQQFGLDFRQQVWSAAAPVSISVDTSKISVNTMRLRHGNAFLNIAGERQFDGKNDFSIVLDSMKLGDIEYLLTKNKQASKGKSFTGTAVFEAFLQGTDNEPLIAAGFYVDNLGYRESVFGQLVFEGRYAGGDLEVYSELDYQGPETSTNVMFLSGTVPASIVFAGEEQQKSGKGANLRFQLKDFPLALAENFLGGLGDVDGTANGDISISGTTVDPQYSGFLEVEDGRGRVLLNNMLYDFAMRIEPNERRFEIKSLEFSNAAKDWDQGTISGNGFIETKDLGFTNFELMLDGSLKVLSPESRASLRNLYGDLYISTGKSPITLSGRFDKSKFYGDIVVLNGDITFTQSNLQRGVTDYSSITYTTVDDVTKKKSSSLFGNTSRLTFGSENKEQQSQFASSISYDLSVSTDGRMRVVIPFSSITQEELNAQLELQNFEVSNWDGSNKFSGEVELVGDSYYLFLGKRFRASGNLQFTGDLQNPDLDLKAVYSETHVDADDVSRKVFVILYIRGSKNNPDIKFDLRYDSEDGPAVARGGNIESDALSFVVLGVFSDEITSGDKGMLESQGSQFGSAIGSSLLGTAISAMFRDAGLDLIKRVEVQNLGTGEERVKITTEALWFLITADAQINNLESSEFSIDFPVGKIINVDNLNLGISRRTSSQTQKAEALQADLVYEVKILYRISW
jgi:hypothetical protein